MTNLPSSTTGAPPKQFRFVGGALCLDFCNSVGGKRGVRTKECLNSYADLLSWSQQAGLLEGQPQDLERHASRNPGEAQDVLKRAIALREAIYRIFMALAEHKKPGEQDMTRLNEELARSLHRLRVVKNKEGFKWQWTAEIGSLDQALGPIARSAADLLICGDCFEKIRQCQAENCGWLFLDSSKNHSRCWCDMRDCGNRAKVRRHRLKQKGSSQR